MIKEFDFLVIGSGIAGMSFALKVAHKGSTHLQNGTGRSQYLLRPRGNCLSNQYTGR